MAVVEVERPENYGIVKIKTDNKIVNMVEKPQPEKAPSNLANAGVYVFTSEIFEEIRRTKISIRGEIEITDAIRQLIKRAEDFYAVKLDRESWLDIGRPWDLLDANEHALKKATLTVEGIVEDGVRLIGSVGVKKGARIRSGAYIEGPVLISEGSQIGPNCYIRPYTSIGENVKIGNGCEIKNSIIMNGSHVPHISYVGDSIIGENCNLGAGTVTGNIRLDEKPVKVLVKNKIVNSGRRKLGAIIGDNVKIGVNVNFMPGVKIGPNCHIGAGMNIYRDIPPNTKVLERMQLEFKEI
jgi:bifunctional UDP-N-acetylglucosamine pyrophosphorylase/glucosamine-1-phosphate N-acetyltransferase